MVEKMNKEKKEKGFLAKLIDKLDQKLEAKAKSSGCCCRSSAKGENNSSCCS